MAHVPGPEGPSAPRWAAARERFRKAAGILAHVCGLTLLMKSCECVKVVSKTRRQLEEKSTYIFPYLPLENANIRELAPGTSIFSVAPTRTWLECSEACLKVLAKATEQEITQYIEKSRAEEWAQFYLSIKNHSANELLFNMSNFSKYNLSKDFAKLKTLMFIQPKQRRQKNLQEIQLCLKKNRSFHSLPNEVQLQLCQIAIYQELEAESMLLRQGHVPLECYLILAGRLKVMSSSTSLNKNTNSEILSEVEEGDFIGEICLLTNTNRPASISCKTDVKLLVISKDDFYCILAQRIQEQYQETCSFLRSLPLFFSWPKEKIDLLVHCSLHRYYRSGPTIISDNFNSHFLVFIIVGRCRIIAQMNCEEISVCSCVMKTGSSTLKNARALLRPRGRLDVTGRILGTTVSPRTSFLAAGEKMLDTKKSPLQGLSSATCFVEIRVLEPGEVFGLAEALGSSCDLHLYLISEGVECIFIPKNLFLAEASTDFRRSASELVCTYPTEEALREYLVEQQVWNEYKARLLAQQLKR